MVLQVKITNCLGSKRARVRILKGPSMSFARCPTRIVGKVYSHGGNTIIVLFAV